MNVQLIVLASKISLGWVKTTTCDQKWAYYHWNDIFFGQNGPFLYTVDLFSAKTPFQCKIRNISTKNDTFLSEMGHFQSKILFLSHEKVKNGQIRLKIICLLVKNYYWTWLIWTNPPTTTYPSGLFSSITPILCKLRLNFFIYNSFIFSIPFCFRISCSRPSPVKKNVIK